MNCDQARELLGGGAGDPQLAAHLAGCAECRALADVVALAADLPEVDLPDGFEEALRARLRATPSRSGWRGRLRPAHAYGAAGVAAALLIAVGALRAGRAPAPPAGRVARSARAGVALIHPFGAQAVLPSAAPVAGAAAGVARRAAASPAAHAAALPPVPSTAGASSAGASVLGRRVVRRVSLTLSVTNVQAAFDRIGRQASALGGFVSSSTLTTDPGGARGDIQLRVPSDALQGLLSDLRQLGRVRSESESDQDVTAQYVDLQARLTALRSEESAYERLFAQATKIADIIQIEQQLTGVQSQIEQLQGQQHLLDNLTSLATVQVTLAGPGAARPAGGIPPVLRAPWSALLAAAGLVLTGAGWLLPWAVLAAIAWGIVVIVRRRRFP